MVASVSARWLVGFGVVGAEVAGEVVVVGGTVVDDGV